MKSRLFVALAAAVLIAGTFAQASVIYNNGGPNQQNGNEATEWIQTEEFTLNSAATVSQIEFWDIEASPGYLGSITWWITGDLNGNPDFNNIIGTGNLSPSRHQTQCGILGVYCEYDNLFDVNVPLQAGVEYHLALHNGPVTDDQRSEFYWETTNPNGTQTGLECNLQFGACYNSWSNNGQEHAFVLYGGSPGVPEPASLLLLGTSLLGIGGVVRKRMKK